MEFKKYNSIENIQREKYINAINDYGFNKGEYIVQEKVHGGNFSIWTNGEYFRFAKRSGFLKDNENFFNYKRATSRELKNIKKLYDHLKTFPEYTNGLLLTIYGELFGGNYPHPEVEKISEVKAVQKEVYYSPDIRFYAFDLKLNGIYSEIETATNLFEKFNIFHAKTLFKGSLNECLKYSNEFQTKIPEWLELPEIKNNICEGIVIKPNTPLYFHNGERIILKNKNENFTEKPKIKTKKPKIKLTEDERKILEELSSYVNENRLNNVISKFGEVEFKDFSKILGMLMKDITEEYLKDNEEKYKALDTVIRKNIQKEIGKEASNLIRKKLYQIA